VSKNTRGVAAYLLLAFLPAWALWEGAIALGFSPGNSLTFQFVALPGAFAPAAAAWVVRRWVTREGFGDAGLRLNLRRGWPYYLAGWLLPFPVLAVAALLGSGLGLFHADLAVGRALAHLVPAASARPLPPGIVPALPLLLLIQALVFSPVLWGEEFGWRGYLQTRLFPDRPLLAALATGVVWGLWHLPLNLRGYNFPGYPFLGMGVFTVSTVLLSIVFGWLRARTGSVWASSLAHAATNVVGGTLALLLFGGADPLFSAYLGILSWVPLGALCIWIVARGGLRSARTPGAVTGP
jgi:membrane protease YdiL (CAAX protease family)